MKKKLNVDQIQSELRGGSAFFPGYQGNLDSPTPAPLDSQPIEPPQETSHERNPVPPVRDVPPVPLVPPTPAKRVMKQRWPVDIYQDQYESLQRLALEERKQGGIGSMSAMVREALDRLIAERTKK
jgi:hypothetical protein